MMVHNPENYKNIRGGKYTRFDVEYKFPNNQYIKNLPLCKCHLPCDVKIKDEQIYFRCCRNNFYESFRETFDIWDEPCSYFKTYDNDDSLYNAVKDRRNKISQLYKTSHWLEHVESYEREKKCIGGCGKSNIKNNLTFRNEKLNLCYDCFINKNDELKNIVTPSFLH